MRYEQTNPHPALQTSPVPPPAQPQDPMDQLRKLGELRDAGVLTNEEFESKKTDILSRL
jgi:hypothetical protein